MKSIALQISIATFSNLLGRAVGFFVPIVLAYVFGISRETDAFFLAYGIVTFCSTILSLPATHLIVPFVREIERDATGTQRLGKFVASILLYSAIIVSVISCLIYLVTIHWLISMLPLHTEGQILFTRSLGLFLCALPFFNLSCLLTGILYARQCFGLASLSPAIRGITMLTSVFFLKSYFWIQSAAIGFMMGEIFRSLFLFCLVNRTIEIMAPTFGLFDTALINFYKKAFFQLLAMVATAGIPLIARGYAITFGPGAITIFEYAEKLYMIPLNLAGFGLFTVLLAGWSRVHLNEGVHALNRAVSRAVAGIGALASFLSCILFLGRSWIIDVVFGGSSFTEHQFSILKDTYGTMTLGLVPNLLSQIFSRGLLVRRNTRYIFLASSMTFLTVLGALTFMVQRDEVQEVAKALVLGYWISLMAMCSLYIHEIRKGTGDAHIHR